MRTKEEHLNIIRQAVSDASDDGFVTTVETVPFKPLAMGNYCYYIAVRDDRERYQNDALALS